MGNLCGSSSNSSDKNKGNNKGGTKTIKMLLLGSGESGKSTVFTQVKIIFQQTFSKEELNYYSSSIYANVLHTVAKCAEHCLNEKIPFQNEKSQQLTQDLLKVIEGNRLLLLEAKNIYDKTLAETVKTLWNDESVRSQYEKRYQYQFHIPDGAMHFLKNLDHIDPPDFEPNLDDVLYCRRKTTGIIQVKFKNGDYEFLLIDVGGQRSERKKWKEVFQGVDVLIYVASLGDFDQLCYEDDVTNRLQESLDLFEEHMNTAFKDIPIMLFLNKTDVFKRKLEDGKSKLSDLFKEYTGGNDFDQACKFIENKFLQKLKDNKERVHVHYTCATEADSIRSVFDEIKEFVMKSSLKSNSAL